MLSDTPSRGRCAQAAAGIELRHAPGQVRRGSGGVAARAPAPCGRPPPDAAGTDDGVRQRRAVRGGRARDGADDGRGADVHGRHARGLLRAHPAREVPARTRSDPADGSGLRADAVPHAGRRGARAGGARLAARGAAGAAAPPGAPRARVGDPERRLVRGRPGAGDLGLRSALRAGRHRRRAPAGAGRPVRLRPGGVDGARVLRGEDRARRAVQRAGARLSDRRLPGPDRLPRRARHRGRPRRVPAGDRAGRAAGPDRPRAQRADRPRARARTRLPAQHPGARRPRRGPAPPRGPPRARGERPRGPRQAGADPAGHDRRGAAGRGRPPERDRRPRRVRGPARDRRPTLRAGRRRARPGRDPAQRAGDRRRAQPRAGDRAHAAPVRRRRARPARAPRGPGRGVAGEPAPRGARVAQRAGAAAPRRGVRAHRPHAAALAAPARAAGDPGRADRRALPRRAAQRGRRRLLRPLPHRRERVVRGDRRRLRQGRRRRRR